VHYQRNDRREGRLIAAISGNFGTTITALNFSYWADWEEGGGWEIQSEIGFELADPTVININEEINKVIQQKLDIKVSWGELG